MHFIRFLKSPRVVGHGSSREAQVLNAKVTVTTDLGEVFLGVDVVLVVEVESGSAASGVIKGKRKEYLWKGTEGMRSLEIEVPVQVPVSKWREGKKGSGQLRMVVRPKEDEYSVDGFEMVLSCAAKSGSESKTLDSKGAVVAVKSMHIDISSTGTKKLPTPSMAERVFRSETGETDVEVHIWEETGESIARHIWDAGLVLSSYLASLSALTAKSMSAAITNPLPRLTTLEQTLEKKDLRVLELGAGCGIVGITLATFFPTASQILLTDLPEASEILSHNLHPSILHLQTPPSRKPSSPPRITHQVLDWSHRLPDNVSAQTWDLVVLADCTYNPDVVPDLVQTLLRIAGVNEDIVVLLAMKVRHESEKVFFSLMSKAGFVIAEKGVIPLPVLGMEDEEIEIFVFRVEDSGLGVERGEEGSRKRRRLELEETAR